MSVWRRQVVDTRSALGWCDLEICVVKAQVLLKGLVGDASLIIKIRLGFFWYSRFEWRMRRELVLLTPVLEEEPRAIDASWIRPV